MRTPSHWMRRALIVIGSAGTGCAIPGAGVRIPGVIDLRESVVREATQAQPVDQGHAVALGRVGDTRLMGAFEDDTLSRALGVALAQPGVMLVGLNLSTVDASFSLTAATMELNWAQVRSGASTSAAQPPAPARKKGAK